MDDNRELEAAIKAYIDAPNAKPKPFRWTKSADDIVVAINSLLQMHHRRASFSYAETSETGNGPYLVAKAIKPEYPLGNHTASLGLAFSTGAFLPERYRHGALSANTDHGTANLVVD